MLIIIKCLLYYIITYIIHIAYVKKRISFRDHCSRIYAIKWLDITQQRRIDRQIEKSEKVSQNPSFKDIQNMAKTLSK